MGAAQKPGQSGKGPTRPEPQKATGKPPGTAAGEVTLHQEASTAEPPSQGTSPQATSPQATSPQATSPQATSRGTPPSIALPFGVEEHLFFEDFDRAPVQAPPPAAPLEPPPPQPRQAPAAHSLQADGPTPAPTLAREPLEIEVDSTTESPAAQPAPRPQDLSPAAKPAGEASPAPSALQAGTAPPDLPLEIETASPPPLAADASFKPPGRLARLKALPGQALAALGHWLKSSVWPAFRTLVLLVVGYTALAGAVMWPVPLAIHERIVGGGELGGWLWRYWLMKLELDGLSAELAGQPKAFFLQMISLGRFPETGNILDLLFISLPLEEIFGHPTYYNLKCLLIQVLNGLAGYLLARHFTQRRWLAAVGGLVAGFNTFVFLELYQSGLRQAILWWLLLSILAFERVLAKGRLRDGILGGVFFGCTAIFYWFYGLFLGMYAVARALYALPSFVREGRKLWKLASLTLMGAISAPIAWVFAYPYLYIKTDHTGALPEVQWFTPFPTLEALQNAPKFPNTLQENLISSLARVLESSWSLDYLWNPLHPRAVPLILGLLAVVVGLVRIRKEAFWLFLALFFWVHTGGPYLMQGFSAGERTFVEWGGAPVKLAYAYTFQFVPMMSRLFAPYRSGGMMWIALAVLLVRNLEALVSAFPRARWPLPTLLLLFTGLYLGQYFLDDQIVLKLKPEGVGLTGRGLPVDNSVMKVHPFYEKLADEPGKIGVIELPLQVQQDLVNYYQVIHQKKLFKGWAVPGSLPPALRFAHHSKKPATQRVMWIVGPDTPVRNTFAEALDRLNQAPYVLKDYEVSDRDDLGARGFKYVILHERGCFMVLPPRGSELYDALKRRLALHLGESKEVVELVSPLDPEAATLEAGMLGEWASSAIPGSARAVTRLRMTIYRMPGFQQPAD